MKRPKWNMEDMQKWSLKIYKLENIILFLKEIKETLNLSSQQSTSFKICSICVMTLKTTQERNKKL